MLLSPRLLVHKQNNSCTPLVSMLWDLILILSNLNWFCGISKLKNTTIIAGNRIRPCYCMTMLQRSSEGPPSGAPYSYRKEKETHEMIFSLLSLLVVLLLYCSWARTHDGDDDDDGVAQHGGHTPNSRLTETCSLGLPCTSLILDIHVMIN